MSDFFNGFRAAASGMAAERRRMQIIASNIANANTVSKDGPYVRKSVVFEEVLAAEGSDSSTQLGGVSAMKIYEDRTSEHPRVFDPSHPAADAEGFVRRPNVNIMFELVDLMVARRSYAASVAAFQAYRTMMRNAISHIGTR